MRGTLRLLFVPIIDLVDVAKHGLVLPFHVVRHSFFPHPGHVALERTSGGERAGRSNTGGGGGGWKQQTTSRRLEFIW